jgi:hypothetical protein
MIIFEPMGAAGSRAAATGRSLKDLNYWKNVIVNSGIGLNILNREVKTFTS